MAAVSYFHLLLLIGIALPVITSATSEDHQKVSRAMWPFSRDYYEEQGGADYQSTLVPKGLQETTEEQVKSSNSQKPKGKTVWQCKNEVLAVGYVKSSAHCKNKLKLHRTACQLQADTTGVVLSDLCKKLVLLKVCNEERDCKKADQTCCWVPGSARSKQCVPEVSKSPSSSDLFHTTKAMNRPAMLHDIRSEMDEWLLYSHGSLQVVVLPVGQGDCIAMQCPNGKLVMFDCGSTDQQNTGGRTRALSAEEVRNTILDKVNIILFISHGDMDHYNYLRTVFSDSNGEPLAIIERVIIGGHPNEYTGITAWLQAIARNGKLYAINNYGNCIGDCNDKLHTIDQQWTSSNQMTSLTHMGICGTLDSPVTFNIIAANVGNDQYKNQKSIVLKVTAGSRSVLFTGDMEGSAARIIARTQGMSNQLRSNVFQISHHGASTDANKLEWLQAINPEEAFVSHAYMGQHGHPRCDAIQRLISIGSIVTDTQFFPNTHPFYCAKSRGRNIYDPHIGETCHRIFSTAPRQNTICVILFTVGKDPKTTYICYHVNG